MGEGTLRALGALEFLTQDADPSGTTRVDACNGFNELSRLAIMWTVRHRWPAEVKFAFNCYRHWAQLLLCQLGEQPVTILSKEGVTQGLSFNGIVRYHPRPPDRRVESGRSRAPFALLCR